MLDHFWNIPTKKWAKIGHIFNAYIQAFFRFPGNNRFSAALCIQSKQCRVQRAAAQLVPRDPSLTDMMPFLYNPSSSMSQLNTFNFLGSYIYIVAVEILFTTPCGEYSQISQIHVSI